VIGIAVYLLTIWRYRLVLRDELLFLNLPAPIIAGSVMLGALSLWIFKELASKHGLTIGWGLREGRTRGGPLQWEDVLFCSIIGGLTLGVGLSLFLNCAGDTGPMRTYRTTVLEKKHRTGKGGYYRFVLTDWKRPDSQITLFVTCDLYDSLHVGQSVPIRTKAGGLGYEWIVEMRTPMLRRERPVWKE
jgi:hypothetical protein